MLSLTLAWIPELSKLCRHTQRTLEPLLAYGEWLSPQHLYGEWGVSSSRVAVGAFPPVTEWKDQTQAGCPEARQRPGVGVLLDSGTRAGTERGNKSEVLISVELLHNINKRVKCLVHEDSLCVMVDLCWQLVCGGAVGSLLKLVLPAVHV